MRTTRSRTAVAATIAGALLALASPALAHAEAPQTNDPKPTRLPAVEASRIKNLKSGKYLQAASTTNGAKVTQQPYNSDTTLQTWETYLFSDYYTFENFGAGKNLGIDGASTASGATAIIANGSSDLNQDWIVDWSVYDGNHFALKNRKSGLCLGISGASTATGAQAAQFRCDGSTNQGWSWA
ncbi:RICIN domain-containing protein [Streptomyces sp. NBC_00557]|uniref:RICIN domain-containing protein n=1 Tax=Streptomyces sp. NBC_00557 TaxID=2975776 RepID=UPI002E8006A4|nr:RICIN domain-containing protein [Streptomyces sp. NBC_00557]WUC36850.1 RICIN domain-containing protein [Streptomyces sp. NBC_00557]